MARISRKCLNELYYHVMVQGINKEYIFNEKRMKERYKQLIFEKAKLNEIKVIAYCIMDNHVHMLVKVTQIQCLSKMMSQVNSNYGKYYNHIKNRVGYVFRDRYRAEPIFNQTHIENCIRYIHENPVKACMVPCCEKYAFSSYNDFKNNLIDESLIEEIYGKNANIIEMISGKYEKYDFIETTNEFGQQMPEDFYTVCQEYANIDYQKSENVYIVSQELKKRCGIQNNQIIEFMGLKRATYYNRIKKEEIKRMLDGCP